MHIFKKKIFTRPLLLLLFAMFMISCSTQNRHFSNIEKIVCDAEENGESYTAQDWEISADQLEKYVDEYLEKFTDQLTKEDYKELGSLVARYHKVKIKFVGNTFKKATLGATSFAEGYMEEMGNSNNLDNMIDSFMNMGDVTIDD